MLLREVIVLITIFPESLLQMTVYTVYKQIIHHFYNETLQLIETSKPENKPDIFSCKIEDNNNVVHHIALLK